MKKELTEKDLEAVAGGVYHIDNTDTVYFKTMPDAAFPLKKDRYTAMALMDGLKGQYVTDAEYDKACVELLTAKGYF